MKAFVGLGPKMYFYLTDNRQNKSKPKGITEKTTERELLLTEYKKVIKCGKDLGKVKHVRIKSHK